ncbi:MAG: hypothetical protein IPN86_10525 [Saprospiraceae bacterium]|nr:hypothetical protein [Saprospiraceae bacterium]
MGSVPAVRSGDVTDCQGVYTTHGSLQMTVDARLPHTRTVTVVPPPAAAFVNPPASETVSCENAPDETAPIVLSYTNNGVIPCLIAGDISATPTVQENPDCSKVLTYLWNLRMIVIGQSLIPK